jgi:hypothetical protein
VKPEGANERDLHLDREMPAGNEKVAVFPWEKLPAFDLKEPAPIDRKQGLADREAAEQALKELKAALAKAGTGAGR